MSFLLKESQLNRLFPFFIVISKDLIINSTGNSMEKIYPNSRGSLFSENFNITRPEIISPSFNNLKEVTDQMVVIQLKDDRKIIFRGQLEYEEDNEQVIFLGSPWFGSMEQVTLNNLNFHDFAYHDPLIDLLHVIKTADIATNDLKELLKTLSKQKKELKKANDEISESALFPQENPDPVIRINYAGELLRLNPTAEKLKQLVYNDITYDLESLFRHISTVIDLSQERWIFEVKSGESVYSFVCKATKHKEYINIYGRDITKSKRDQRELERLSLIIHETQNAVIVTDSDGRIEWVNNAFFKVTGYTLEEAKGKTPGRLLQGADTDPETVIYMREKIQKAQPFTVEIYNYRKNGSGYWLRINAQPILDVKGQVTAFFAIEEDITSEREAQEKLKAAASRMSSLISNLNAGIILENKDGSISLINKQLCSLFGIKPEPESLIGTQSTEFQKQYEHLFKDSVGFKLRVNEVKNNKEFVTAELLELIDGRSLLRDFIPIYIEDVYEGHLLVYTDITDKINAEKKFQEQRIFYEKILDNIPTDIAVFDKNQRFMYVNPTGISDDNLRSWVIGKTEDEFLKQSGKSEEQALKRKNLFDKVLNSKMLESWEESNEKSDGHVEHVLFNLFPVTNEDEIVELVIGYAVDITKIKIIQQQIVKSEKRYRDVIDNGLALISTHDMNGVFLTINPMVSKVYGYSEEAIIGKVISDFFVSNNNAELFSNYISILKKDKYFTGLIKFIHKDGHVVYTLFNNYLKEEPGEEPYVICFAVDISERVKAQKELEIAKKTTEELALAKQNFLANMSHEIRTPMNGIIGMANQLAKTDLDKSQSFFLENIMSASDNLLIIINDILDLSKIEAGKLTIEEIGFEPDLIVDRAMQVMKPKAEEKGLVFEKSYFDPEISNVLLGDPFRLNQVLLNLISNAIKFTEKGRIDISCNLLSEDELTQTIKISVTDTGIGMDDEFVKKLFSKFTQEDESITRKFGGTGLGMNISSELIDLMGGTIDVESAKGQGTTIVIQMSCRKGTDDDIQEKKTIEINKQIFQNKRFLVTDDNEMNRLVASTILKSHGASVEEAVDGKDAIKIMENQQFDLVLMDVQMPIMNGLDATKYIRENISSDIPIIALTAYALKGDEEKFLKVGMNDYLSKPFDESVFLNLIAKYLGEPIETTEIIDSEADVEDEDSLLFNLNSLNAIAGVNPEFIKQICNIFVKQAEDLSTSMQESFNENDFERIRNLAHGIKPSIDNMGIISLYDLIREIERTEWDMSSKVELGKQINNLNKVLAKVCDQLKLL